MPTKYREPTDAELEAEHRRYEELLRTQPLAIDVRYDGVGDTIIIEMNNGAALVIPRRLMQGLSDATPEQLRRGAIWGSGMYLEWEDIDAQFEVVELLAGVYGGRRWMSELARRAGSKTSPAKTAAARRNGAKGGRPRKASA
ncbi:MAG TPA: DUF2442 domain-containing protein [Candidatus Lustribacter sp.]|jgi:hypothetical protein|nr:DUF2442 domain-containing protein [Candidatus Lustribacter sp.]